MKKYRKFGYLVGLLLALFFWASVSQADVSQTGNCFTSDNTIVVKWSLSKIAGSLFATYTINGNNYRTPTFAKKDPGSDLQKMAAGLTEAYYFTVVEAGPEQILIHKQPERQKAAEELFVYVHYNQKILDKGKMVSYKTLIKYQNPEQDQQISDSNATCIVTTP